MQFREFDFVRGKWEMFILEMVITLERVEAGWC